MTRLEFSEKVIVEALARMSKEQQNEFFKRLRESNQFTDEEIKSMMIIVSYLGLKLNPEKEEALKRELCDRMYTEFIYNGK